MCISDKNIDSYFTGNAKHVDWLYRRLFACTATDGLFGLSVPDHRDELIIGTRPLHPPQSPFPNKPYVSSVDFKQHERKSK